jgi:hypothetical protein
MEEALRKNRLFMHACPDDDGTPDLILIHFDMQGEAIYPHHSMPSLFEGSSQKSIFISSHNRFFVSE